MMKEPWRGRTTFYEELQIPATEVGGNSLLDRTVLGHAANRVASKIAADADDEFHMSTLGPWDQKVSKIATHSNIEEIF